MRQLTALALLLSVCTNLHAEYGPAIKCQIPAGDSRAFTAFPDGKPLDPTDLAPSSIEPSASHPGSYAVTFKYNGGTHTVIYSAEGAFRFGEDDNIYAELTPPEACPIAGVTCPTITFSKDSRSDGQVVSLKLKGDGPRGARIRTARMNDTSTGLQCQVGGKKLSPKPWIPEAQRPRQIAPPSDWSPPRKTDDFNGGTR